jgi:CDR ABC transporter
VQGAITGETTVLGDNWADSQYGYSYSHVWRYVPSLLYCNWTATGSLTSA